MKKHEYGQLFQEAERLETPPGLWTRIVTRVDMEAGRGADSESSPFWRSPMWRAAASVVLAAGFLGLGLSLKHGVGPVAATTSEPDTLLAAANAAGADAPGAASAPAVSGAANTEQMELVDPELLVWHEDLGDMDTEADEAEEVL
jgi:hypothetical protein